MNHVCLIKIRIRINPRDGNDWRVTDYHLKSIVLRDLGIIKKNTTIIKLTQSVRANYTYLFFRLIAPNSSYTRNWTWWSDEVCDK